jgi:hypothetical protein
MSRVKAVLQLGYCTHVVASRAAATARLRAAAPLFANATGASDFRIFTIPHIDAALYTQLLLAFDSSATSDANLDVQYAAPFPGQAMIGIASQLTRDVSVDGTPITLVAGGFSLQAFVPDRSCATKQLDATTAVAGNPTVAGAAVTADESTLPPLPVGPVEVTWDIAVTGPVDYYLADLQEVRPKEVKLVRRIATVDRHALFDRDLFVPGHLYVINLSTVSGSPGASSGDFDTRISPIGIMSIVSPTFRPAT